MLPKFKVFSKHRCWKTLWYSNLINVIRQVPDPQYVRRFILRDPAKITDPSLHLKLDESRQIFTLLILHKAMNRTGYICSIHQSSANIYSCCTNVMPRRTNAAQHETNIFNHQTFKNAFFRSCGLNAHAICCSFSTCTLYLYGARSRATMSVSAILPA